MPPRSSSNFPLPVLLIAALVIVAAFAYGLTKGLSYFIGSNAPPAAASQPTAAPAAATPQEAGQPSRTAGAAKANIFICPPGLVGKTPICR
jgi:hypothetical protein